MKYKEYVSNVRRTEAGASRRDRLLHAALGLVTESGEIADTMKRALFYESHIDETNLIEEAGDVLWYLAVLLDALSSSFDEAMEANVAKLRMRYPGRFSPQEAQHRDVEAEEQAMLKALAKEGVTL